jgi:hypothetical protein
VLQSAEDVGCWSVDGGVDGHVSDAEIVDPSGHVCCGDAGGFGFAGQFPLLSG